MIVKYWFRTMKTGTHGPFQCEKSEISQMVAHWDFMWLRVELPNGDKWFKAPYVAGGRWVKLK